MNKKKGELLYVFNGHDGPVLTLCLLDKNQNTFASAGVDRDIRLWDYKIKRYLTYLSGHE